MVHGGRLHCCIFIQFRCHIPTVAATVHFEISKMAQSPCIFFWPAIHNLISYFAPTNLPYKRLFLSGFLGVVRVYCMPLGSLQQEQHFPDWALLQGLEQLRPCNVATDLKMIRRKKTLAVGPAYFLKAFVLWKTWCITMR